tara:strand:- start:127 stop:312 length:186 start_codon:yes stop_codon:yes gene_type:complete
MTKTEVIEHYGGVTKAANALGVTKGAVSLWSEDLPAKIQCLIEVVSKGKLKADKSLLPQTA